MRILVTGGTGSVGREVQRLLAARGHTTRVLGRRPTGDGGDYVRCDVTDYAALKEAMRGCDAVAHLAAVANPVAAPDEEIFRQNCLGSYNVYHAASELGIRRVVSASSINAFGYHFGLKSFPVRYLPIDEEHPTFTTDPYSFSKQVLEQIAEYYWRREGISGCCLRLPWVANATPEVLALIRRDLREGLERLRAWIRLAPEEGRACAEAIRAQASRVKAGRMWEYPARWEEISAIPDAGLMSSYTNFFTQVDARDSAQAFEKALLAPYEGSHPLFINDTLNRYLVDSRELARLFFPEAQVRESLRGASTFVSIEKARRLIGYEPVHTIDRLGVHEGAG